MSGLRKWEKKQIKQQIAALVSGTSLKSNRLDFVDVTTDNDDFTLVGCGCSSAVFRSVSFPQVAVKVYSPAHVKEILGEILAYKKVKGLKYFPRLYFYGTNHLVIEYIEGKSLYDCLIDGIEISEDVINEVDEAIALARERGLVPSDVHFKNVILTKDGIKLVDLSDYLTAEHVSRWDRLKFFYKTVYKPLLKGVRIPKHVVDFWRRFFKMGEIVLELIIGWVKRV